MLSYASCIVQVHFVNESGLDESGIDMGGLYKASPLLALLVVYWHYWYKRTNKDTCGLLRDVDRHTDLAVLAFLVQKNK
jgi:hypothetical protein